jgi:adenosylcobinamide-GDP ribazoletransferase
MEYGIPGLGDSRPGDFFRAPQAMGREMGFFGPLFAGLAFLTILPVPRGWCGERRDLERSRVWFPLIGLLIGLLVASCDAGATALLPVLPASVLTVLAMVAISGALHLDGLADTADGFLSARPRARILEIMRDSRVGPMGVLAIAGMLLLKVAAVASLAPAARFGTVLLMPLAGRVAPVLLMSTLGYARENGLATAFQRKRGGFAPLLAMGSLVVAGYFAAGPAGVAAAAAAIGVTGLFALWCRAKIGGYTGDTLGAACELAEVAPALVVLMAAQRGGVA